MCKALGITAAPRREKREQQKKDIAASYDMTVHKNNSITLVPITKKMRADREWEAKKATCRVVEIDEVEVDLGSNYCFRDTGIDTLVWNAVRRVDEKMVVKSNFVCDIFARTRFFKELLNKEAALPSKYSKESYAIVQDKVVSRLTSLVNNRLQKWEAQGLIETDVLYCSSSGRLHYDWKVQPYIDEALRQLGLKSEFQANMSSKREEFYELRNTLFEAVVFSERVRGPCASKAVGNSFCEIAVGNPPADWKTRSESKHIDRAAPPSLYHNRVGGAF